MSRGLLSTHSTLEVSDALQKAFEMSHSAGIEDARYPFIAGMAAAIIAERNAEIARLKARIAELDPKEHAETLEEAIDPPTFRSTLWTLTEWGLDAEQQIECVRLLQWAFRCGVDAHRARPMFHGRA